MRCEVLAARFFLMSVVLQLFAFGKAWGQDSTLVAGMRLSETMFKDWKYGDRSERKQLNCVQFIAAVVEDLVQRKLVPEERDAIYINNIGGTQNLSRLILQDDKRIRGIQTALVQMGKGEIVLPADAKAGVFIQFWRKSKGKWHGHTAIIMGVTNTSGKVCALLYGSHRSLGRIGIANYEIPLEDPAIRIYLVRFKS